jgi:hypothetical protein
MAAKFSDGILYIYNILDDAFFLYVYNCDVTEDNWMQSFQMGLCRTIVFWMMHSSSMFTTVLWNEEL